MYASFCLGFLINAQVVTRVLDENQLQGFRKAQSANVKSGRYVLPSIDNNALIALDDIENKNGPLRFGKTFSTSINFKKVAMKNELENGILYSLEIESRNAFSLNFVLEQFYLSDGAELIIYNSDKTMLIGPITSKNNNEKRRFRTDLISGNKTVLELFEPSEGKPSEFTISKIVHGYRNLRTGFGSSASCNIDVNCSPYGNGWTGQSNSVVLVLLNNNRICSGALLNNACQDFTPNILSAFHCIDLNENGNLEANEIDNAEDWVFRFRYKSTGCGGPEPPSYSWITYQDGATYKASWRNSDFALVEMLQTPSGDDGVQYAGWSRNITGITNSAGIHHPNGDVMKISIDDHSPSTTTPPYFPYAVGNNHFWNVSWDHGITARGSSGSPLFNNDGRIIGQLAGGFSFCSSPQAPDQYGRFDESWDGSGQGIDEELGVWLTNDPNVFTTDQLIIPQFYLSGNFVVSTTSSSTVVIYNTQSTHDVTWTASSNLTILSQDNSSATVKYSGYGYGEGVVTAHVANDDPILCPVVAEFDYVLQAGPFTASQIDINGFSGSTCYNTEYGYTANVPGLHQPNYTYTWDYPQGWTVVSQWNNHIILNSENYVYSAEPIGVTINNGAGNSDWANIWVYNGYCSGYSYSYSYYPNPVSDELTVILEPSGETSPNLASHEEEVMFSVRLFDIFQQPVAEKESCDNEAKIDIRNLRQGLYIMHIIDQNGDVLKKKIIVE